MKAPESSLVEREIIDGTFIVDLRLQLVQRKEASSTWSNMQKPPTEVLPKKIATQISYP